MTVMSKLINVRAIIRMVSTCVGNASCIRAGCRLGSKHFV